MRSASSDALPLRVRRSLAKLGADVAVARRKRGLTMQMMAERLAVAKSTYVRVEKGDPSVARGIYAMSCFVLGFGDPLGEIIDAKRDDQVFCSTIRVFCSTLHAFRSACA